MGYEYGYGVLEDELIALLRRSSPDYSAAEDLIARGADLNAQGKEKNTNILAGILLDYRIGLYDEPGLYNHCKVCGNRDCAHCENDAKYRKMVGENLLNIIRFFLSHGFDVEKDEGRYGAQCLWSLVLATFDRHMLDAIKLLLDAGAEDIPVNENDGYDTPGNFAAEEASFQDSERNYHLSNLFEAAVQIYEAVKEGRSYAGIDTYETAVGRRITGVFAEHTGEGEVFFEVSQPGFKRDHCYTDRLYFVFDGGVLITDQYANLWVDDRLPDKPLKDCSDCFPGVVGSIIRGFSFSYRDIVKDRTHHGQPIVAMELDNGMTVMFTINFGEVEEEHRAAYYWILDSHGSQIHLQRNRWTGIWNRFREKIRNRS